MKYLNYFENFISEYIFVGDHILLSGKVLVGEKDTPVKVVKKDGAIFQVQFDDGTITSIHKNSIIRPLNKEEILNYNIKLKSKKYNI